MPRTDNPYDQSVQGMFCNETSIPNGIGLLQERSLTRESTSCFCIRNYTRVSSHERHSNMLAWIDIIQYLTLFLAAPGLGQHDGASWFMSFQCSSISVPFLPECQTP